MGDLAHLLLDDPRPRGPNKRPAQRVMEIMGARAGPEIPALARTTEASRPDLAQCRRDGGGVRERLDRRDRAVGDYRARPS